MRTTLDIDDDILVAAREHAALERRSIGSVISSLARAALRTPPPSTRRGRSRAGGRFAVLPSRTEIVTMEHVRSLQDAEGA